MDIFNLLLLISKLITIMLTTKLAIQFYKQGGFKIKGFHKMNISGKNEALKQADGPKYNKLVKDTKPYFVGVIPEQYRTERDRKAQPPKDVQKKKTVEKKADIEKKKLSDRDQEFLKLSKIPEGKLRISREDERGQGKIVSADTFIDEIKSFGASKSQINMVKSYIGGHIGLSVYKGNEGKLVVMNVENDRGRAIQVLGKENIPKVKKILIKPK